MSRGRTLVVTGVLVLVVVATVGRTWATGTADDAVLGSSAVSATGGQAAPGALALVLAAAAAVVAALITRPVIRRIVLGIGALAAAGATAIILRVLADPEGVLGPIAAKAVGRSGALAVRAQTTGWVEAALAATVTLTVLLLLSLWSAHRWGATSRTYDADADTVAGARGERVRSDWDALSAGHDPTDVPDAPRT